MGVHETVAIGVGVVACASDLRTGRVPNVLTFGAALAACAFAAWTGGLTGVSASLVGWMLALLIWLPFYALGGMGAGDVKLLAAIGAWLGPAEVIPTALYAAIAGGAMALGVALWRRRVRTTWLNVLMLFGHWRVAGLTPHPELTLATAASPRLAYAVPVLAGTLAAVWLRS